MTVDQIQQRLAGLISAMMAKGLRIPNAEFNIRANANFRVWMTAGKYGEPEYFAKYPSGETVDGAFAEAQALIDALPDPEAAAVQRHMDRVATCIDKGREDGIDDAYITPLVAVKTAMTENLLTKQVVL